MIIVKEVKTKRDIRKFATYPLKLYKNCPYYVPSFTSDEINAFNPKKNHGLKDCECKAFLCYKDGKLVGRIMGIISHNENKLYNTKFVRFSRFECIDDIDVFKALLGAVGKYGKENGLEDIHGPWGFNDTDREGMLTFGFNERSTYATNYYYPYFSEKMRELGYNDESKWIERRFVIPKEPYDKITNISSKLKEKYHLTEVAEGKKIKEIIKLYADKLFETYNDAYSKLDGFTPVVGEEVETVKAQFGTIINPKYLSILIDEKGDCAAFGVLIPSICNALIKHKGKLFPFGFISILRSIKKPKELEMALIGVKSEYKNSGINSIVINRIMENIIDGGIVNLESNPMLETNYNIQQQWKFAENEVIKKRQTFKKEIGENVFDYIKA